MEMEMEMELEEIEEIIHNEIDYWINRELKAIEIGLDVQFHHGANSSLNWVLFKLGLPEYKIWYKREE